MSEFGIDKGFPGSSKEPFCQGKESFEGDKDLLMEQILDNINTTPVGQVLKKIAALPEVRKEKVLGVRHQLNTQQYDINGRLDIIVDKVLEELIS